MSNILFLDKMQQVIKSYDSDEFIECVQTKEITTNASELMNDTLSVSLPFDETIKDASYIAVNDTKEQEFSLYRILTAKDEDNLLSFEAINFAVDELDNFIIKDIRPKNRSFSYVINQLLSDSGCDWVLGVCEPIKTVSSTFYYTSMREAIKALQELGAEFTFSIEITGNKIAKKIIHCYNQIGKITNKRFEYGEEVLKIVHQQDRTNIVTALIGRGKGEEVGDGYGRRLEFSDVEWRKSNGKPLDKPKGQNWIEYSEMTKEYGIPSNGKMLPRKTVVVFDDVEDASELLQKTYDQLAYYCRPLVQFSTEILGSDSIGNTVSIHRGDRNYHYQTRVFKVVTDHVNGRVQASLGDNLSGNSINRQLSQVQSNISDLDNNKMTFYDSTEIGKYQDDIMRGAGANGGSIYMVNGIEAGVSQSRETYEQVFMDGPRIQDSQYFMIQNNAGISFKQCKKGQWTTIQDVHNGKSNTAWTLDGTFNANFINAGVLQGVRIRSVHHDFIIELDQGKIRFIKRNGSSENEMFAFAPTYAGGQLQGINAIQNQGYSFALSSKGNNGALLNVLEIPKDSTAENRKLNLYGEVKVDGNFYVNGVKIDTNGGGNSGGGGGWNGQYPPEVTSDRDKRYWQIWAMAIGAGFSKQAAAALLGNAQGESDANPTADEGGGRPGFGYGVWQWTDSSGASSGRVYMINLMTRAGVTDNPDTITAQFKLLMWHAQNGQWIAKSSYPYSWTQFMTLTNINTATQAFVANFERPLNGHPERSTWAQEWYNKFVNLKIPSGGGGYIAPISSPITVTSEMGWRTSPITGAQEFHNAMDLVNGNPTTPILASGDGQVVQAGSNYYDWYGNYTVIKHADGLYTGYAHQSRIDVSVGQNVKKGQQIGLMGATGPVTGPHLHFQFMDQYWPSSSAHFKNPRDYIKF
ncbi:peptidase M23 [Lactococcus lactis subsp. lactis]|uniref:Prophage TAL n=8 Tax=Lactococcus lactis TaxID=1358 RepID=A0A1V0NI72_LACLL|nr:phage tail spike protein [Lactococcus lactis]ADZ64459.1 prophage pi2 protein 44 [Lactococcus lactis subsp. lactis CV56]MRM59087.1 peptidoglycan DD-metalloendopeptidase family protein [Lactococcus cremoris]ARD99626.1 prophage TAL [Lactococcus lactis subsp. lactis]KAF0952775.1 peptidase M23 [Lactococcus lactis subsp. lactis]KSU27202.1 Membrane protein [Lactococcus lactis subsp. lactis]